MAQIFGDFIDRCNLNEAGENSEFLMLNFTPASMSLQERWRNNGLSADFLAEFLIAFFPGKDVKSLKRRSEIKGGVSFIANELLENATKFNYDSSKHSISIEMELITNGVAFYVTNTFDSAINKPFQNYIQRLLTEDTNDLFIEKIMENAEDEEGIDSGLGYLTMINDWNASLAWRFENSNKESDAQKVTVMVRFPFE